MNEVIIGGYSVVGENKNFEFRFSIPSLELSKTTTVTQEEYLNAIQKNGFDGVKQMLVTKLQEDIDNLLKQNGD